MHCFNSSQHRARRFVICFIYLLATFKCSHSFVDLFLDSNETSTLLGYPGSFFYVFNGEVRYSSISYRLDIPEYKDSVEFAWKTSGNIQKTVTYRFDIAGNSTSRAHSLSVNSTGAVPNSLSRFKLFPSCPPESAPNGSKADIVYLALNAVFRLNNSAIATDPQINLTVQFRKLCSPSASSSPRRLKDSVFVHKAAADFTVAYIIIGALGGFVLFVALVAALMYAHSQFKAKKLKACMNYDSMYGGAGRQSLINQQQQQTGDAPRGGKHTPSSYVKNERQGSRSKPPRRTPRSSGGQDRSGKLKLRRDRVNANESETNAAAAGSGAEMGSNPNIYETLQDASTSIIVINQLNDNNEYTSTRLNLNARKSTASESSSVRTNSKYLLNLTTNTIQSVHNNTANNMSSLSLTTLQNTNANTATVAHPHSSRHTHQLNSVDMCMKFKPCQIELGKVLMSGTFSCWQEGYVTMTTEQEAAKSAEAKDDQEEPAAATIEPSPPLPEAKRIKCLVKTINDYASLAQADMMLRESCLLRGFKHKNLNPLLGICVDAEAPRPMALFPLCELGNLKSYLLMLKLNSSSLDERAAVDAKLVDQYLITTQEILYIVLQLLKGLNYLHGKRLIHRDIAARNCWLDKNFSLKLADYSLARDMFPDDYACLANNENKPIKWMSIESLRKNVHNIKADVWSCGVTIWECFALASQPYDHVDAFDMARYLEDNEANRLPRTANCPPELFDMFARCWHSEPASRPSLKELFYSMHKYYTSLENYV